MLPRRSLVVLPSLAKPSPLFFFSFFTKFPHNNSHTLRPLLHHHNNKTTITTTSLFNNVSSFSINNNSRYLTTLSATSPIHNPSSSNTNTLTLSKKAMRKARRQSPEGLLKHNLDMCSRHGDLLEALRLYDEARRDGVSLALHHYNVLLYLCALDGERGSNLQRGFEIFQSMVTDKVVPNEATFTSAARIAAAKEDPDMAFDLIKQMKGFGIVPKLRSYGPALFGFVEKGMAERAYEVDKTS